MWSISRQWMMVKCCIRLVIVENTLWDTVSRLLCCVSVCCVLPFDYTLSGHDPMPLLFVYIRWMDPAGYEDRAGRRLKTIIRRAIKSAAPGGHQSCERLGKAPTTLAVAQHSPWTPMLEPHYAPLIN